MGTDRQSLTPLVLLVDDQEWTSRSIESILRPKGHVVLKAYTGQQALELVRKVSPDVIIIDFHLPDMDGIELARQLRQAPTVDAVTPLLMVSAGTVGRAERLEALGAGVWDILRHPVDPSELILRMETFVRAKHEADRIREEGLTDPGTGLYNVRGLLRRATEISADAIRYDRPLACIAFGPEWSGQTPEPEGVSEEEAPGPNERTRGMAWALRTVTRLSDTIGRLGTGEFVVVAPGTNREGALRLADRVLELIQSSVKRGTGEEAGEAPAEAELRLRAGFFAASGTESVSPEDLLFKATMALRRAQADLSGFRVRSYEA
ncbi:MAG TPA: response regulator [Longimicrobiales bacterium]|nr:response regulator [Longimicrobiales bacterium]